MVPYYSHAGITIYHGDCREILPSIDRVDLVLADPPYGETNLEWDRAVRGWLDAAEVITSAVWCFGSMRMFLEMARLGEASRWRHVQEIVWEKHNGSSFLADRFKRVHELIVHFVPVSSSWADIYHSPVTTPDAVARIVRRKSRPPHWHGRIEKGTFKSYDGGNRLMRSVIYARSCHGTALHPTQKPIEIIRPLLQYSVPPQGRICECFMGAGSGLIVAQELGMSAIGIEIEEKYCEIAAKRLSQEVFQFS